jgi:hypothetical protein
MRWKEGISIRRKLPRKNHVPQKIPKHHYILEKAKTKTSNSATFTKL